MAEAGGATAARLESHGLAEALHRDSPAEVEYARDWVPQVGVAFALASMLAAMLAA